jgi:hypothetical protein
MKKLLIGLLAVGSLSSFASGDVTKLAGEYTIFEDLHLGNCQKEIEISVDQDKLTLIDEDRKKSIYENVNGGVSRKRNSTRNGVGALNSHYYVSKTKTKNTVSTKDNTVKFIHNSTSKTKVFTEVRTNSGGVRILEAITWPLYLFDDAKVKKSFMSLSLDDDKLELRLDNHTDKKCIYIKIN